MTEGPTSLRDEAEQHPTDMLGYWRGRIFTTIFASALVAAIIPYILNFQIAWNSGQIFRAAIISAVYVAAIVATFWRSIPFGIRAWWGLSLFYLIGIIGLSLYGPEAGGRMWLLTFAVLTTLLLGLRAGVIALGINTVTMFAWLWASSNQFFDWSQNSDVSPTQLLATGFSFLFMNAVATISLGVLVRELEKGFKKEKRLSQDLMQTNDKLLQENAERRTAEDALRESETKYRLFAENVNDMIWTMDIETRRITYVSASVHKVRGFSPEEAVAQSLEEILTPSSLQHATVTLATELAADSEKDPDRSVTMELEEYKRDGSTVWTETTASFLREPDGKPTAVLGVTRDITERRQVEETLREQEQALARSKKMESLGLMAGGIAHDLNNILSGIVSYPDLLLAELPADSQLRKPIETIRASGERAAAVVEDLLTVARGVASGRETHNLNNIIQDYLGSAEQEKIQAEHQAVEFRTALEPDLLNVRCSESHLRKSLLNLVLNASEAIHDGGAVTISTDNRYLDEPLKEGEEVRAGEYVVLTISDTGIGITQEHLERIFEPFYTRKMMGRSGTGLGLAVVWNTIQDHEGYVDVKSSDSGTVFELYFPATREEADSEKGGVRLSEYVGSGEKVLVVDDEENQRKIACRLLRKLGYEAVALSSGEEAVEFLKIHAVDLVLLDMIMPNGMNGCETYERIVTGRPGQRAVIASGFAETEDVKAAQRLGAGEYLKKPYTLSTLGAAVRKEMRRGGV